MKPVPTQVLPDAVVIQARENAVLPSYYEHSCLSTRLPLSALSISITRSARDPSSQPTNETHSVPSTHRPSSVWASCRVGLRWFVGSIGLCGLS
jgi:hypothetical protein